MCARWTAETRGSSPLVPEAGVGEWALALHEEFRSSSMEDIALPSSLVQVDFGDRKRVAFHVTNREGRPAILLPRPL